MKNINNYTIKLNQLDNVLIAIKDVSPGIYYFDNEKVKIRDEIKKGFKIAESFIEAGSRIYKYGQPIGAALRNIKKGEIVHIHNMRSLV